MELKKVSANLNADIAQKLEVLNCMRLTHPIAPRLTHLSSHQIRCTTFNGTSGQTLSN